ncbi:GntR family transcriptional regulator [Amycolatopsis sp. cg9]|uniref:GntR family transcriptional regulator n=1 Tax=Amycolatopsis sp. cg9 TaxID=3238801 RepID=UPI0035265D7D
MIEVEAGLPLDAVPRPAYDPSLRSARERDAAKAAELAAAGTPVSARTVTRMRYRAEGLRGLIDARGRKQTTPHGRADQSQLARRFEVSRTPVREALRRLIDDRLVSHNAFRGASVRAIDVREAIEISEIHDGLTAQLAAQRASAVSLERLAKLIEEMRVAVDGADRDSAVSLNQAFHELIYELAGNSTLTTVNRELAWNMGRFS